MTLLADISRLAGERGKGIWTTGKIHVQMQELDGYVYFGALDEDSGPPAIDPSSYRGPHWYHVNISSGKVDQLGLISSFWGLTGQAMDKKRRLIFGLAENGHLYRCHIDDDCTEDLGRGMTGISTAPSLWTTAATFGNTMPSRIGFLIWSSSAYQFDAMVVGVDGTIFCGNSERGGRLYFYMPGPAPFAGTLNPANPPLERMKAMPVIHGPADSRTSTP